MKIGIISESPVLTTGFAIVTNQIAHALAKAGHNVVCFGIGVMGEVFDRNNLPYRVWAVGNENLIPTLSEFFSYEKIDLLIISLDLVALDQWVKFSRAVGWDGPIIGHFVTDGLPIADEYLEILNTLQGRITATYAVRDYLENLGIKNVQVAPHGVNFDIFSPLDKKRLRQDAGINNKFVIGMFGRNNERKQHPRLLMALVELIKEGKGNDILLYLHCQAIDEPGLRGWDLAWLSKELGIEKQVIFAGNGFKQLQGVPLSIEQPSEKRIGLKNKFPDAYNYIERINCCDMIINVSYCGGFELGIIEAQACGVPIAVTNDKKIMAEVASNGAYLLEPCDIGVWTTGAKQFFVHPKTIASAIQEIRNNSSLREDLIKNGLENCKKYSWENLHQVVVNMVKSF